MKFSVNTVQWGGKDITAVEIYNTLPSTNTFAKGLIKAGRPHGTVVWALNQTEGRGRRGRSWSSDCSSLTFSVLWRFADYEKMRLLPLAVGLGLVKALQQTAEGIKVKWPNDLWVGERKLGGILVESVRCKNELWAVVGVGLNIFAAGTASFPARISLQEASGGVFCRFAVLSLALAGVERGLTLTKDPGLNLNREFMRYGNFLGRQIIVKKGDSSISAVAKQVLPDGRLLIETEAGSFPILADEISLRFS
ncbi:MAG TPA: biotin--[acetyl-CoA-carboxylase] ligase, partial [Firmicutes bacterium]|nr:biotin--[acetyl-CoA-carboxylase] ligase [Bacillota bacterium]